MGSSEALMIWGSVVCYALATITFLIVQVFRKERWVDRALWMTVAAVVLHGAALALRVIEAGHVPVKGDYENALTGSLFITLPAVVIGLRSKRLRLITLATAPLALFLLGFGLMRYDIAGPLTPPYRSTWLVIHVTFAQLSYGAYSLAFGSGLCYLLRWHREEKGKALGVLERLPGLDELDDYTFRFVVFGFVTSAMMIIAGSFWADALWGNYWNWDPVETWSLISWLVYGLFIHLRLLHKWSGRKLAWLAVVSIVFVLVSFWGVNFMASSHVFRMM